MPDLDFPASLTAPIAGKPAQGEMAAEQPATEQATPEAIPALMPDLDFGVVPVSAGESAAVPLVEPPGPLPVAQTPPAPGAGPAFSLDL